MSGKPHKGTSYGAPNVSASKNNKSGSQNQSPRQFIVWQNDIKIAVEHRDTYIRHIAENYYYAHFKNSPQTPSEWGEWLKKQISNATNDGEGFLTFSLPLIVVPKPQNHSGWNEYKMKGKTIYYRPLPPLEDEKEEESQVDTVFADGDKLIGELLQLLATDGKDSNSFSAALDAARDKEKQALADALKADEDTDSQGSMANQLKELEAKTKSLTGELEKTRSRLEETSSKLDKADATKREAVEKKEKEWSKKYDALNDKLEDSKRQAKEFEKKWTEEERKRIAHEHTIGNLNETIAIHEQTIKRMQEETALYSQRVVFFRTAQGFAQQVVSFFDVLDQLLTNVNRLKENIPSGVSADDYNYYLVRIERKYYSATSKLEALPLWQRELRILAQTGLVPTGGLIDKKMGSGQVKEQEWESTLRMLLYQSVMNTLAGAAVVMSDELALMLPRMVGSVRGTDVFPRITEQLRKTIANMGYELNYVKPFTRLDDYMNIQNVEFTKADVPQGTIFEVLKMALNFGSRKDKTEVSAK